MDVAPPGAHPYRVWVGAGLAAQLDTLLAEAGVKGTPVAVSSPPIWELVKDSLASVVTARDPILIPDGEQAKHLGTVAAVYDGLVRTRADRATTVVAVGGGVVGDVAGFAAATYLRGVPLVQVPTTLLAQVDSAVGGKVGVNHPLGKNLIGAFHQPRAVIADPLLLSTLPAREFRAGVYEVVKYGMIASPTLFERLSHDAAIAFERDPAAIVDIVAECCAIKAAIVMRDEREQGERRTLNFGHTVGHALEAITEYQRFLHGEAVGYGMVAASAIAVARGVLSADVAAALKSVVHGMGPLPPVDDLSADEALGAVRRDKKVVGGTLHFVLPVAIGRTEIVHDVTEREIGDALLEIGLRG